MSGTKTIATLVLSIVFGVLSAVYHPLALVPALVLAFLSGKFFAKMSYEKGRESLERMVEELDEEIAKLDEYIEERKEES